MQEDQLLTLSCEMLCFNWSCRNGDKFELLAEVDFRSVHQADRSGVVAFGIHERDNVADIVGRDVGRHARKTKYRWLHDSQGRDEAIRPRRGICGVYRKCC